MKQRNLKRLASLLLSVMVFMVFTMASAVEVNAASTKYIYLESKVTTVSESTYTMYDGTKDTSKETYTSKYFYKNGLQYKATSDDGYTKYTRDKKGYVTGITNYDKKGKKTSSTTIKRRTDGNALKYTTKQYKNGKLDSTSTTTYEYWKNGMYKKVIRKDNYGNTTNYYDKKGNLTKSVEDGGITITYSRTLYKSGKEKGRVKKETATYKGSDYMDKSVTSYTYKFKNGRETQSVQKTTDTHKDGSTSKSTFTSKLTYKNGRVSKEVYTSKSDNYSSKYTTTFKYTKVKVPKKYWHLYGL